MNKIKINQKIYLQVILKYLFISWYCIFLILYFSNNVFADDEVKKFVSLKGKLTNTRNGPGEEYPVIRVYNETYMPLAILHRIDNWYMVSDFQDKIGWIRVNLVNSNAKARSVILKQDADLCILKLDRCLKIANLKKHISANVIACNKKWCRIRIKSKFLSGWIKRDVVWGVLENEIF